MAELGTVLNGHTIQRGRHRLPSLLIATRHGESIANVAFRYAEANGELTVPITTRDADIPLSPHGRTQAQALGRWLADLPAADRPHAVWCSPYVRTAETARIAVAGLPIRYDERLRDRELGVLEMLTKAAIEKQHPTEAARRRKMGELYYRPPGGESWLDVALRVRSLLRDLSEEESGRPVLVVAHDCTVLMLRYVLDQLSEDQLLELSAVENCSTSLWRNVNGCLSPERWNEIAHLRS